MDDIGVRKFDVETRDHYTRDWETLNSSSGPGGVTARWYFEIYRENRQVLIMDSGSQGQRCYLASKIDEIVNEQRAKIKTVLGSHRDKLTTDNAIAREFELKLRIDEEFDELERDLKAYIRDAVKDLSSS